MPVRHSDKSCQGSIWVYEPVAKGRCQGLAIKKLKVIGICMEFIAVGRRHYPGKMCIEKGAQDQTEAYQCCQRSRCQQSGQPMKEATRGNGCSKSWRKEGASGQLYLVLLRDVIRCRQIRDLWFWPHGGHRQPPVTSTRTVLEEYKERGLIQFTQLSVARNTLTGNVGGEVGKFFLTRCEKDCDRGRHRAPVSWDTRSTVGTLDLWLGH